MKLAANEIDCKKSERALLLPTSNFNKKDVKIGQNS